MLSTIAALTVAFTLPAAIDTTDEPLGLSSCPTTDMSVCVHGKIRNPISSASWALIMEMSAPVSMRASRWWAFSRRTGIIGRDGCLERKVSLMTAAHPCFWGLSPGDFFAVAGYRRCVSSGRRCVSSGRRCGSSGRRCGCWT